MRSYSIIGALALLLLLAGCASREPATAARAAATPSAVSAASTPAPTPHSIPTTTPRPTPTPTALARQEAAEIITPSASVRCEVDDAFLHCHDSLLDLSFAYPHFLGDITGTKLRPAWGAAGIYYEYELEHAHHYTSIGGRSRNFTEGREPSPTDLTGFDGRSTADICANRTSLCEAIRPGVVFGIEFPTVPPHCNEFFYPWPSPHVLITLNLPDHPLVNGFGFSQAFFDGLESETKDEFWGDRSEQDCTPEGQAAFAARMADLRAALEAGTAEPAVQMRYAAFRDLAASIQGPLLADGAAQQPRDEAALETVRTAIAVLSTRDAARLKHLIHYTPLACVQAQTLLQAPANTQAQGSGIAPRCRFDERSGELVDGLPVLGADEAIVRPDEIDVVLLDLLAASPAPAAVIPYPQDPQADPAWRPGRYALLLWSEIARTATALLVDEGGIVGIYTEPTVAALQQRLSSPSGSAGNGGPVAPHPQATPDPLLPASLYVQNANEVLLVDRTGAVVGPVASDYMAISDFDVSPVHGRVVYVAGNRLVEVDPATGSRIGRFGSATFGNTPVSAPRYSPDGARITFIAGNELLVVDSDGERESAITRLIAADRVHPRELQDAVWAPDGTQLLLTAKDRPYRLLLYVPHSRQLIDLAVLPSTYGTCCEIAWHATGLHVAVTGHEGAVTNTRRQGEDGQAMVAATHQRTLPKTFYPCSNRAEALQSCRLDTLYPDATGPLGLRTVSRGATAGDAGMTDGEADGTTDGTDTQTRLELVQYGAKANPAVLFATDMVTSQTSDGASRWGPQGEGLLFIGRPRHGDGPGTLHWIGLASGEPGGAAALFDLGLPAERFRWGPRDMTVATALTPPRPPTPLPQPVLTPTPVLSPTPAAPSMPTPTSTPAWHAWQPLFDLNLPAPLYFLDEQGVIMRLSADGTRLDVVAREPQPIIGFDLAPEADRLVYIVGNRVVERSISGGEPTLYADIVPSDTEEAFLRAVRYSPDGAQVAVAGAGIHLLETGDPAAAPAQLAADIRYHQETADVDKIRTYVDVEWSPDGRTLLVTAAVWEGWLFELLDAVTGEIRPIEPADPDAWIFMFGDWAWDATGSAAYLAARQPGWVDFSSSNLYRVDPVTGRATPIDFEAGASSSAAVPRRLAKGPLAHGDGHVDLLLSVPVATGMATDYRLHRLEEGGGPPVPLGGDTIPVFQTVLWAGDGRGLVVGLDGAYREELGDAAGWTEALWWVETGAHPRVDLGLRGRLPRWGRASEPAR